MPKEGSNDGDIAVPMIEEFNALREEILLTIEAQHSVLLSGIPILTGFLGVGFTLLTFNLLLASLGVFGVTSVLAVALLSLWMAEESRRVRASFYIATKLEKELELGWEKFVHTDVRELKKEYKGIYFPSWAFERHYALLASAAMYTLIVMFLTAFVLFNAGSFYYLYVTFSLTSTTPIFILWITAFITLVVLDILYLNYLLVKPGRFRTLPKLIGEERRIGRQIKSARN